MISYRHVSPPQRLPYPLSITIYVGVKCISARTGLRREIISGEAN